ncbi:MAG: hypothetical protein V3S14_13085 [Anaerolineae bacterium]
MGKSKGRANPRMHATWLIGALFEFLTRIEVSFVANVLTPQPPSTLCGPFGGIRFIVVGAVPLN